MERAEGTAEILKSEVWWHNDLFARTFGENGVYRVTSLMLRDSQIRDDQLSLLGSFRSLVPFSAIQRGFAIIIPLPQLSIFRYGV